MQCGILNQITDSPPSQTTTTKSLQGSLGNLSMVCIGNSSVPVLIFECDECMMLVKKNAKSQEREESIIYGWKVMLWERKREQNRGKTAQFGKSRWRLGCLLFPTFL